MATDRTIAVRPAELAEMRRLIVSLLAAARDNGDFFGRSSLLARGAAVLKFRALSPSVPLITRADTILNTDCVAGLPKVIADAIDAARKEHRQKFPHDDYKAANIALGGLRSVASHLFSETRTLGNEETSVFLQSLPALSAAPDTRVVTVAQLERWLAYAEDGIVSVLIKEIRAVIGETKK